MKKEKADLEQLLNSLIEKGWKPFDRNYQRYEHGCLIREFTTEDGVYSYGQYPTTYRELVSKESGLWQFVCENKLVKRTPTMWERYNADTGKKYGFYDDHSTYRIIESSLKDESELEEFLLDNIKVEGE